MRWSEIVKGFAMAFGACLVLAAVGGWIWNVVKIVGTIDAAVTGMFVARVIGVFVAPLGSILGFM